MPSGSRFRVPGSAGAAGAAGAVGRQAPSSLPPAVAFAEPAGCGCLHAASSRWAVGLRLRDWTDLHPQPQGPATPPSPRVPRRQLRLNISSFSPSPLPATQTKPVPPQPSCRQVTAPATQPLRPEAGGQRPRGPTSPPSVNCHFRLQVDPPPPHSHQARPRLAHAGASWLDQGLPASLPFYKQQEQPLHVPIH